MTTSEILYDLPRGGVMTHAIVGPWKISPFIWWHESASVSRTISLCFPFFPPFVHYRTPLTQSPEVYFSGEKDLRDESPPRGTSTSPHKFVYTKQDRTDQSHSFILIGTSPSLYRLWHLFRMTRQNWKELCKKLDSRLICLIALNYWNFLFTYLTILYYLIINIKIFNIFLTIIF